MSFAEVLRELPSLSVSERQLLIRRALELDEQPLSDADENLIEGRLADHRKNPSSAIPLDAMKNRLRDNFRK